ncbi:MAG: hypothetical protein LC804_18595 [Acidobacteria bacterium]|nr:hypothetical protein [Acidobacteriota bacterium]
MTEKADPKVVRLSVSIEDHKPKEIAVRVSRYIPSGGPSAIVANSYDPAHRVDRLPDRPDSTRQLYLCGTCGQDGTLSHEWLSFSGFNGEVRCPVCFKPMHEVPWPHGTGNGR